MLDFQELYFCFSIALFAFVFAEILIQQDGIFEFYGDWVTKLKNTQFSPLSNMLGYCSKCFAGQISFWGWLIINGKNIVDVMSINDTYLLFTHIGTWIMTIIWSIFFTFLLTYLLRDAY